MEYDGEWWFANVNEVQLGAHKVSIIFLHPHRSSSSYMSLQSLQTFQVIIDVNGMLMPLSSSIATGRTHNLFRNDNTRAIDALRCRHVTQLIGKGIHIDTLIKYLTLCTFAEI